MSRVRPITSVIMVLVAAATGALQAQTGSQDTSSSTFPNRGPITFPSDTNRTTSSTAVVAADAGFIRQAVGGSAMEVELGQVAQRRAADDDVEEFAQRMVNDHTAMGRQWYALAQRTGVTVQAEGDAATEQTVQRLERLSGSAFDRAYMTEMVRHHDQELARLQQAATSARSAEVRRLAATGQTTVREHLTLARELAREVGGTPVAGNDDDRDRDDRDRDAGNPGVQRTFMTRVLSDHLLQVRLGRRAEREAKTDEIRQFAERLADDFAWWQERWREVAPRQDMETATALDRQDAQRMDRLRRASGQQVDRVYARIVADQLESLVAFLRDQREANRSEAVQRVVDNELPVMQAHLARARKLQVQAGSQAGRNERN